MTLGRSRARGTGLCPRYGTRCPQRTPTNTTHRAAQGREIHTETAQLNAAAIHLPIYPKIRVNNKGTALAPCCELVFLCGHRALRSVPLAAFPRPHGPTRRLQEKGTYICVPEASLGHFIASLQITVITRSFKDLLNAVRPDEMTFGAHGIVQNPLCFCETIS